MAATNLWGKKKTRKKVGSQKKPGGWDGAPWDGNIRPKNAKYIRRWGKCEKKKKVEMERKNTFLGV